jgi:NAD(P)-dependent dehydrogenase (short-subunit alcohol dehydrogenase family)
MPLTARTILVTGASRGLGLEFVKQILKLPTAPEVLIATCRDPSTARDLQVMADTNPSLKIVKMDVENDQDIETALTEVRTTVGERGLNLLINNAGIYLDKSDGGGLTKQTRERMQKHFDVNVSGPLIVIQKFAPLLQQAAALDKSKSLSCSKAGIITISSVMGSQALTFDQGLGTAIDYKSSKTALTMLSILLARELKDSGIFVAALHPGWVKTDMGGENATLTADDSIKNSLSVIGSLGQEKSGKLISYNGDVLPF